MQVCILACKLSYRCQISFCDRLSQTSYTHLLFTYRTVERWVKAFREARYVVLGNLRTGWPHVEKNTVQLLALLLDYDVFAKVKEPLGGRPPLWFRWNVFVSHVAGPGSIPGRVSQFPGWGFPGVFPSTIREMSGNLDHIRPGYHMAIIYHPNHDHPSADGDGLWP